MRKFFLLIVVAIFGMILTACQGESNETESESLETTENSNDIEAAEYNPKEPTGTGEETCAVCDMKVYPKNDEMGKFSAQSYTKDEEHFWFDDLFCMIQHQKIENLEHYVQYVRDYESDAWINAEEAYFVQADIKTPMNVGIASFVNESDAERFSEKYGGTLLLYENIVELAQENYDAMIEQGSHGGHDHEDMEKDNHNEHHDHSDMEEDEE